MVIYPLKRDLRGGEIILKNIYPCFTISLFPINGLVALHPDFCPPTRLLTQPRDLSSDKRLPGPSWPKISSYDKSALCRFNIRDVQWSYMDVYTRNSLNRD